MVGPNGMAMAWALRYFEARSTAAWISVRLTYFIEEDEGLPKSRPRADAALRTVPSRRTRSLGTGGRKTCRRMAPASRQMTRMEIWEQRSCGW